jgi:hypothetical protein
MTAAPFDTLKLSRQLRERPTLKAMIDRIGAYALDAGRDEFARSLRHAYAACLSPQELCDAAVSTLDGLDTLTNERREASAPVS